MNCRHFYSIWFSKFSAVAERERPSVYYSLGTLKLSFSFRRLLMVSIESVCFTWSCTDFSL